MIKVLKILLFLCILILVFSCSSINYLGDKKEVEEFLDSKIGVWNIDDAVEALGSKDNPIKIMRDTSEFKYAGIWKVTEYNEAEDLQFSDHYTNKEKTGRKMYVQKQTIRSQREFTIWFDNEFIMKKYTIKDIN